MSYSAQGSITIKRLRSGETLNLVLQGNGIALFQGVDTSTGEVTPDFTQSTNQPTLTPVISLVKTSSSATLSAHKWYYNGELLVFDSSTGINTTTEAWNACFKLDPATGSITIIANLASPTNYANDTLTYSGVATVNGTEYQVAASKEIQICSLGASAYNAYLTANTEIIGEGDAYPDTATITPHLLAGTAKTTPTQVKWYKTNLSSAVWATTTGKNNKTISRTDVDGYTLFIAVFYVNGTAVAQAGIHIRDISDEYVIDYVITSDNKTVDTGKSVVVKGIIRNLTKQEHIADPDGATWETAVIRPSDWNTLRTVAANTVTITTSDTDTTLSNGAASVEDVEVSGSVSW